MRPCVKKKLLCAAAASTGVLGFVGYPSFKSVYPIKKQTLIVDDYVDLPPATEDLTKDIILPESVGAGTDVPIDISHWLLLSFLRSKKPVRRARALEILARQRRWNDAECREIAQALDRKDIIRLARTDDADLRLFLPPPSTEFLEKTLQSDKIEKFVKSILRDVSEKSDSCSSCANFYTNLSIKFRPDSNILAMSDLNQVDKMMHIESRKRKRSAFKEDTTRLKAVLNNVICGEEQALSMVNSGLLLALMYFYHKYKNELEINALLAQIVANLSAYNSTAEYLFTDGWVRILTEYARSDHLELSIPAWKTLANLDQDEKRIHGTYGGHLYLLAPTLRGSPEPKFDVIFVHGLVGSVFKSWRQGSIVLDSSGHRVSSSSSTPTTELLPTSSANSCREEQLDLQKVYPNSAYSRCWPKDWLPQDLKNLRVLAVDYPTELSSWRTDCDLNKDTLRDRAIYVMKQMEDAKLGDRPIVWVTHSMGGLLVKQIMVLCGEHAESKSALMLDSGQPSHPVSQAFSEKLLKQTKGIVFYSVPHKGSNLGWIERKNLQKMLLLTTEVIELQKGSPMLTNLHEKFLSLARSDKTNLKFLTYAEDGISTFDINKVVQWKGVLVHMDSLNFEIGPMHVLNIDHAHTCKPHDKSAISYVKTLDFIKSFMPQANIDDNEELLTYISFIV